MALLILFLAALVILPGLRRFCRFLLRMGAWVTLAVLVVLVALSVAVGVPVPTGVLIATVVLMVASHYAGKGASLRGAQG